MTTEFDQTVALRLQRSFDQTMLDALAPGALIVGLVYGLLSPVYFLNRPPNSGSLLVGAALLTAATLVGLGLHWRRQLPNPRHAQTLGALVLGAVLVNNGLFLAAFPEPIFAGTLCAVLLAAGWFFLTLGWFTAFVTATIAVFAVTVLRTAPASWFGPTMLLIATGGLAAVIRAGRARTMRRLELLRIASEERALEERRQEAVMRRTQKLGSLEVMAGGIAHDFNNLLTAIIGNASLAIADTPPQSRAASRLQNVIDAGNRASRLTGQLLTYTGHGLQQMEPMDISAQVRDMAELLASSLPTKAQLNLDLASEIPAIDADSSQLQQVVMNLVLNAGHALEGGADAIHIRTGATTLSLTDARSLEPDIDRSPGLYVFLEVEDHGCGMADDILERIFDPFFTTREHGHGLGLAAVLGIVRGHGGGLRVATDPGRGSLFRVYFPASKSPLPSMQTIGEDPSPTAPDGIALVVDDEQLVREMAGEILTSLGWEVLQAASGNDAIEAMRAHGAKIRFCLLDMNMPGLGGEETMRALRGLRPELPIMLTSGYSEESVAALLTLGHTTFLPKPYGIAAFSDHLNELLEPTGRSTRVTNQ